jgi:hypothetical protein
MPPLAKFAAAPFGIVERFAEPDGAALLPVTLRSVEPDAESAGWLPAGERPAAQNRRRNHCLVPQGGATTAFFAPRKEAAADVKGELPACLTPAERTGAVAHGVAAGRPAGTSRRWICPSPWQRPAPVRGGGHSARPAFMWWRSPRLLGAGLLDARHGTPRTMYVRTSALVTNLACTSSWGAKTRVAWVTTLDKGQPVPAPRCGCRTAAGKELATGRPTRRACPMQGLSPEAPCLRQCGG